MSRYIVWYKHPKVGHVWGSPPENWGIADIKEGFWVDQAGVDIAPAIAQSVFWIPPHKVDYVEYRDTESVRYSVRPEREQK